MGYKTGNWGEEAKARAERRKASGYFREYAKKRRELFPEKVRGPKKPPSGKRYGLVVGTDTLEYQRRLRRLKKERFHALKDKCSACGYSKCKWALHFHHIDPTTKRGGLADMRDAPMSRILEEIAKCIILCSNCHAEEEYERASKNLK